MLSERPYLNQKPVVTVVPYEALVAAGPAKTKAAVFQQAFETLSTDCKDCPYRSVHIDDNLAKRERIFTLSCNITRCGRRLESEAIARERRKAQEAREEAELQSYIISVTRATNEASFGQF